MITFFTTGKPFRGHDGIIQRNALQSWKLLRSDVEVILFGDDEGAAEVCAELGLRHEPQVERHESGTKYYLNYMFARAQQLSRHEYLCFSNCDIILFSDFMSAFEKTLLWRKRFLLVGRRWDTDVTEPIDFSESGWEQRLRRFAKAQGFQQTGEWIDFFLFSKGLYLDMPPLIVGHCFWDAWMVWKALSDGVAVVDATPSMFAVHQNHGYGPEFGRAKGATTDALSQWNLTQIGTWEHLRHIEDATQCVRRTGIRSNRKRHWRTLKRSAAAKARFLRFSIWNPIWFSVLGVTRPLRRLLGLRSAALRRSGRRS